MSIRPNAAIVYKPLSNTSYIITDPLAADYAQRVLDGEGYSLTNTEAEAIDNFCKRIKGLDASFANFGDNTIYQKALGFQIAPMLGNTLGTKKYNLMPAIQGVDLYLTFFGGCTANYDGVTTNGVNGYISSNIIADNYSDLNSTSVCVGNVLRDSSTRWDFGTYGTTAGQDGGTWRRMGTGISSYGRSWSLDNAVGGGGNDNNAGHTWINLFTTASQGENYHNSTLESINTAYPRPTSAAPYTLPYGGVNVNGNTFAQASNTMMFCHYIAGLPAASIAPFNSIVDNYMIELSKKTY